MELAVQKIEWASLKPLWSEETFENLRNLFIEIVWSCPPEERIGDVGEIRHEIGPWVFIKLVFKKPLKRKEFEEFIRIHKLD